MMPQSAKGMPIAVVPAVGRLAMNPDNDVVPAAGRLAMNPDNDVVPAAGRLLGIFGHCEEPASGRHYRGVRAVSGARQRPALPGFSGGLWSRPAAGISGIVGEPASGRHTGAGQSPPLSALAAQAKFLRLACRRPFMRSVTGSAVPFKRQSYITLKARMRATYSRVSL